MESSLSKGSDFRARCTYPDNKRNTIKLGVGDHNGGLLKGNNELVKNKASIRAFERTTNLEGDLSNFISLKPGQKKSWPAKGLRPAAWFNAAASSPHDRESEAA